MEEGNRKAADDLQAEEDKVNHLSKVKAKLENNLEREKKKMEEGNRKAADDLQAEEDKVNHLSKVKAKLEDNLEREKKARSDLDKVKRKLETELKQTLASVDDLERIKRDMDEATKRKDLEYGTLVSKFEDEQATVNQDATAAAHRKKHQDAVGEMGD